MATATHDGCDVHGQEGTPSPGRFEGSIMAVAMMIHFPLPIIYGLILGWIVHDLTSMNGTAVGVLFGFVLYFVNFYLIAPAMFPWFMQARNRVSLGSHLIYGAVLGAGSVVLRKHKPAGQ
jgi:hypothetical protein